MSFIISHSKEQVCYITLSRPDKFNSFCREMAFELHKALDVAKNDPEIRCLVISGEGKAFCAGQDLGEAIENNGIELEQIVTEHYNPIIERIRKIEKPVIAAVNGVAAGAGANIALCCDIVLASESASFIQAFSKIGLIPDSGGTFFLPRLIGVQRATALMMTGEKVGAQDAVQMGMIYKCFPAEQFQEAVQKFAEQLAQMPTKGLGLTKRLLNESWQNDLSQQLKLEGAVQVEASETHDYREGVRAFLEKRPAQFKGH